MDLSFSDLKYFITTSEIKNISKAAEELGIRQPSLSLAIKKIEKQLDVTLFHRSRSGVILTKEGKELYRQARDLLNAWDEAKSLVKGVKHNLTGTIRFGCHASVALFTLNKFLPVFLDENPEVHFEFIHGLSRDMTEKVILGELDMAIVVNPVNHLDLVHIKLYEDEVCLWGIDSKSSDQPLICDMNLLQSKALIKKLKKLGISTDKVINTSSLENIVNLVESGVGVGIIPTRVVEESSKGLVKINNSPLFKDEHYLIYRYENKKIKLFSTLKESIVQELKN